MKPQSPFSLFVANGLNFNVNCASKAGPIPAILELIFIIFRCVVVSSDAILITSAISNVNAMGIT